MTKKKAPRGSLSIKKRAKPKALPSSLMRWVGRIVWIIIGGAIVSAWVLYDIPTLGELIQTPRKACVRVLSREGTTLATYGDCFGERVEAHTLPPHVTQALLAIEDRRFFEHHGFDYRGIARAMWVNFRTLSFKQGASTLTQQLAKALLLASGRFRPEQRSFRRKVQEAVLTGILESRFSKNQILSLYLNRVYFGRGLFGLDAASRRYFSKSPHALSLFEAAVLAGLVQAPSRLSPLVSFTAAHARATHVLDALVQCGWIEAEAADQALQESVDSEKKLPTTMGARYAADWVYDELLLTHDLPPQDLVVRTTLSVPHQQAAFAALQSQLMNPYKASEHEDLKKQQTFAIPQGALIAMDADGAIRALIGGNNDLTAPFNRAVHAERQPGSAFKIFVFLTALEHGLSLHDRISDASLRIGAWRPKNFGWVSQGEITLKTAFAHSVNTATVRLAQRFGVAPIITRAQDLGVESVLDRNLSLALGTSTVTLLELTRAYASVAAEGFFVQPYLIQTITNAQGNVIFEASLKRGPQVIAADILPSLKAILAAVIDEGTARALAPLVHSVGGHDYGGKTGTTQDHRDAWFVGYRGSHTVGIWVGHDDDKPMRDPNGRRISGSGIPVQIWHAYMKKVASSFP